MSPHQDPPRQGRAKLAAAAITGLFAGAARAVTDWLLHHLASH